MQRKNEKNKGNNSGSNLLGLLVAGAVGAIGGYLFNKLTKEDANEKAKENAKNPLPSQPNSINSNPQVNMNNQPAYYPGESNNNQNFTTLEQCDDILCPITLQIMEEPVVSNKCGHSFESSAISDWVKKHDFCPKCHVPLTPKDLTKNYNLKNTIEYMKQQQNAILNKEAKQMN